MNDASPDLEFFAIDADREAAFDRETGAAHLLSRQEAAVLRARQRDRSIDLGSPSEHRVSTVALTTRNRSSLVDRWMGDYQEGLARCGRRADLLVLEDSDSADRAEQTRAVLARRAPDWPGTVRYADRSDRLAFAARLTAEAGVDPGVARFALLGDPRCAVTTGAARNGLLLALHGHQFLLTDDDTRYRVAPGSPDPSAPVWSAAVDPTRCWFYPSFEQALEDNPTGTPDLLGLHERLLGGQVGDRAAATGAGFGLTRRPAQVRATMMGLLGDCGMSAQTYLSFDPESLARLTRSEAHYYEVLRSRQILRRAAVPTVGPPAICFATNLGLDATRTLPPFAPVQRNSDGLFARLLRSTSAGALVGHLPAAIVHQPLERRERDPEACWTEVERTRWPDLVGMLIDSWGDRREHEEVDRALPRLGAHLVDLADQPLHELEQALRRRFWRREARRRQQLAPPPGLPGFFLTRRLEYDRRHLDVLCRPEYVIPRDLATGAELDRARRLSQELTGRLGEVLRAWPALWQAAAALRDRGQELGRPPGQT